MKTFHASQGFMEPLLDFELKVVKSLNRGDRPMKKLHDFMPTVENF